ncbi:MAG: hypothetical protein MUC99_02590 [Anaerolineae bacterium]|nr:hypothetical protein [Anaerolineae bacterium]
MKKVNVRTHAQFERDLEKLETRYKGVLLEVEKLIHALQNGDTLQGDRIKGIDRVVYKIRLPNRAAKRGKSGGFRVIYCLILDNEVILLTIYSKTDKSDISAHKIRELIDSFNS